MGLVNFVNQLITVGAAPCMNMYESYSSWKPSAFSDLLNTDFGYKIPCFSGPRFRLLARKTK